MPVPLALAAPAALAAGAYLNARTSFWYDAKMLRCYYTGIFRTTAAQNAGRANFFYTLESQAQDPKLAAKHLIWFEGRTFTYAATYDAVLRYGHWLSTKLGVKRGDIVAMDMQNSEQFVFVWFAIWAIGAKPAFINYNLTGASLSHCIKVADTKLCIVDEAVAGNVTEDVKKENSGVKFVDFTAPVRAEAMATDPVRHPDAERSVEEASEMAILIYTSGTTGMPKPAVVSWSKVIVGGTIAAKFLPQDANDVMYSPMPMYHSSASLLAFASGLIAGRTQAIGRKFSTKTFWPEVRASNANMIQYVGETLRYLLAAPPQRDPTNGEDLDKKHRVRVAFGNGLRPDVWNKFKERFGIESIAEFFAATEGPVSTWNYSSNDLTAGAIGRHGWLTQGLSRFSTAMVQVDWDTDQPWRDPKTGFCKRVKNGTPGELIAKLPEDTKQRYQGYYGNAKASESKVLRDVFSKGDAYYRTGDVLRWDSDGRVFFHDRIGDTFRWKSENVSTAEVGQVVGLHPSIHEANVYGVSLPHHDGRCGCAAIWLSPSSSNSPSSLDETMRSLAKHVREQLPSYAQPLFLRVQQVGGEGGTQLTGTNKQQKHGLRKAGVKPHDGKGSGKGKGANSGDEADPLGALYWLRGEAYVPFGDKEWRELQSGRVKL